MELKIVFELENQIPKLNLRIEVENLKIKSVLQNVNPNSFTHNYLTACGIENVERYLFAGRNEIQSPTCYLNIDAAADRLYQAIENGEKVAIISDCDVDGICSAAICYQFLVDNNINPVVLHHTSKQHGVRDLLPEILKLNPNLLVVPDAGTNDTPECMELKSAGIDALIADHHEIERENLYAIVVNCMMSPDANKDASGTTVMAKVVEHCCDKYGYQKIDFTDLIALSLLSDSRSMYSIENRAYLNLAFGGQKNE